MYNKININKNAHILGHSLAFGRMKVDGSGYGNENFDADRRIEVYIKLAFATSSNFQLFALIFRIFIFINERNLFS